MEKIDLKDALKTLRAAVTRDTSATDVELSPLYVMLHNKDGALEYKATVGNIASMMLDEYCNNPNKYLP